jgi:hypothetical protein
MQGARHSLQRPIEYVGTYSASVVEQTPFCEDFIYWTASYLVASLETPLLQVLDIRFFSCYLPTPVCSRLRSFLNL